MEAVQAAEVVTEAASVESDDDSKENREGRDEKARKELARAREAGRSTRRPGTTRIAGTAPTNTVAIVATERSRSVGRVERTTRGFSRQATRGRA